jgi:hypothetical protein
MEIIHMTAAYSNAVLVAVLPYVNDFATRLHIPIQQPISTNQLARSYVAPTRDAIMAGIWLTNGYWFAVGDAGYVQGYRAPTNFFAEQEFTPDATKKYLGKDNMTTNEAVDLARKSLLEAGFKSEWTHADETPTVEGPFDMKIGHAPYCGISWETPKDEKDGHKMNHVRVEINMESKTIAGMTVQLARTNKLDAVPLRVDVPTELESDFRKRTNPKMFINTNAPKRLPESD